MLENAYCEHANEDNSERRKECSFCFDHVRSESDKIWGTGGKMDITTLRKVFAKYMVCADNYLAPTYTKCFLDVNYLINTFEETPNIINEEQWSNRLLAVQSCVMHIQFQHLFRECEAEAAKRGEGWWPGQPLVTYTACARARVTAWVMERGYGSSVDVFIAFLRGGDWMPSNGDLI